VQFSVIYSVDVPQVVSVRDFAPPQVSRLWTLTEDDGQYEYDYLEGRWEKGKHRKWVAVLNRKQFDAFVSKLGLYAQSTQTLGSLGAPGFGIGWSPAISFTTDDDNAIVSAYVSPVPETSKSAGDERDWERVRRAVLSRYAA
jgi:hypothetical protein